LLFHFWTTKDQSEALAFWQPQYLTTWPTCICMGHRWVSL